LSLIISSLSCLFYFYLINASEESLLEVINVTFFDVFT
jgi:hypothetical protein